MAPFSLLRNRLFAAMAGRRRMEEDLAVELHMHLERLVAYNCRAGMTREQALAEAQRRLGYSSRSPVRSAVSH